LEASFITCLYITGWSRPDPPRPGRQQVGEPGARPGGAAGDIIESTFGRKVLPFGPAPVR
jgi:hypothetical protein